MSDKKIFRLGMVLGRFQPLHAGHEEIIRAALARCERVCVLVGSAQEMGTEKNPFSYALRRELLADVFGHELSVYPLPDAGLGNNSAWGGYVLQKVRDYIGVGPDLFVSGEEQRRESWFAPQVRAGEITELFVPKTVDISAERMRVFLKENNLMAWQAYTNPCLWSYYETLRELVLSSGGVSETASM